MILVNQSSGQPGQPFFANVAGLLVRTFGRVTLQRYMIIVTGNNVRVIACGCEE